MAQNISLLGATYSDVPAVVLPKSGGGEATFVDEDEAKKHYMYFGTCSTAAATQAKTVTIDGITELYSGLMVRILFSNYQNYNGVPTLNVNSLGAKNIQRKDGTNAARYEWASGEVLDLVYNGSVFVLVNNARATTTDYGETKLSSSVSSTSTALAATPSAVKKAYDLANGKQDALTFDSAPTEDSTNPVTSGGVHTALSAFNNVATLTYEEVTS